VKPGIRGVPLAAASDAGALATGAGVTTSSTGAARSSFKFASASHLPCAASRAAS
jgi:hypothetical protein